MTITVRRKTAMQAVIEHTAISNERELHNVTSANPKAINVHTGENCQELSGGRYIIRSMTNSAPARLSSQLQRYPYNPDKAVIADHNAREQELMKDNKATLRPASKCKMLIKQDKNKR